MDTKNFTLQLDGTVSLDRFAEAIEVWRQTLDDLSGVVGTNHVLGIYIEDLSSGSALVTSRVDFDSVVTANQFSENLSKVSSKARGDNVVDFPATLDATARRIRKLANQDPNGLTIATEQHDVLVLPETEGVPAKLVPIRTLDSAPNYPSVEAYGQLRGKLQSVSSRSGLRAVLYEVVFDKAVRFTVTPEQHELLRELWDAEVVIEGLVRRDSISGRPLSIPEVWSIQRAPEGHQSNSWERAFGVLEKASGGNSAKDLIQRVRNG